MNAGVQLDLQKTGIKVNLPLYANRTGAAINGKYTVLKAPSGSRAVVEHPDVYVSHSARYAYIHEDGNVPAFTPDKDGQYVIQLTGNLAFPDRAYPEIGKSTATLTINVGEGGRASGCAAIPVGAPAVGLAIALMALLRRRRQ